MRRTDVGMVVLVLVAGCSGPLLAGAPPADCTPAGGSMTCDLRSDLLVFAQGDPIFEINAQITSCTSCSVPGPGGEFTLTGDVRVALGPYDPGLCAPPASGVLSKPIGKVIEPSPTPGGPGNDEQVYRLFSPVDSLLLDAIPPLRVNCVAAGNLDYQIPRVILSQTGGAATDPIASPSRAFVRLPESVRASKAGVFTSRLDLDTLRISQGLSMDATQPMGSLDLRLWPEGLPIRFGPDSMTFRPTQISFDTPGPPGAPPAYAYVIPSGNGLAPGQAIDCNPVQDPEPLYPIACSPWITNHGYLSAAWQVGSSPAITTQGLSAALSLGAGETALYEALFPRRQWVRLDGPASLVIDDGEIRSGGFDGGTTWLRMPRDVCALPIKNLRYSLLSGAGAPLILDGGGLLAGVGNLNQLDPATNQSQTIDWTFNEARTLGCGTLYHPGPVIGSLTPQKGWLDSLVPTVRDRGIYAGVNYNRNRVCDDGNPATAPVTFCASDSDCPGGQTCQDGGYSPLCGPLLPAVQPEWLTTFDANPLEFMIDPDMAGQGDREMAFFLRFSGVSGVFDAGDPPLAVPDPSVNGQFQYDFDQFGLAFKQSRSERADTIVHGGLVLPWPSATTIPFQDMQVCNCGAPDAARAPNVLIEKKLKYWDAAFSPYGIDFSPDPIATIDCAAAAAAGCEPGAAAVQSVCIEALTPVPRFEPVFVSRFPVDPAGEPGEIDPLAVSRFGFDRDADAGGGLQKPYTLDVEGFRLSEWPGNAGASEALVFAGAADLGHYDARGELLLAPFFGLRDAGMRVEHDRIPGVNHRADLHAMCPPFPQACDAEDPAASFIWARRTLAADNLEVPFRVDYVPPGATADPADGSDAAGAGRGTLLAFAAADDGQPALADELNLGSLRVAASLQMKPLDGASPDPHAMTLAGGDIGPAAGMRLYGLLSPGESARLKAVLPCAALGQPCPHLDDWEAAYSAALTDITQSTGGAAFQLPDAESLRTLMRTTGAIERFSGAGGAHPDVTGQVNVAGAGPGLSPPMNATEITGALQFSADLEGLDLVLVGSNLDTGGEFFAFESSLLTVDRHVKEQEEPIASFARETIAGASDTMAMPGRQVIPFAASGSPLTWDLDYDVTPGTPPTFAFRSLTGTVDLTKGGLSGVGFDELGAGLGFYNDGDWYFTANMIANFDGNLASAGILMGDTQNITPLQNLDWNVAEFLGGISKFSGAYVKAGAAANIWDNGCLLQLQGGGELGGWYLDDGTGDSFGAKWRGFYTGDALCLVGIRADMTLIGGVVNDTFKIQGTFWAAGGAGLCDEDEWHTPEDVLDDDFCTACVVGFTGSGHYPPKNLDITFKKDYLECALP